MDHQMEDPCTLKSESLKEGINPDEWSSIRALLKAKKTKSEDEKLEYEKRKWFEIFKLLFPGTSPPDNPCKWCPELAQDGETESTKGTSCTCQRRRPRSP